MSESDSSDISFRLYGYHPNKPAAIIAGVIFSALSLFLFVRLCRWKTWWGLCLPIGALAYAGGYFLRYVSAESPDNTGLFAGRELLLVTSPAAFLAFNYIVYGRLIRIFADGRNRYSLVRPEIVARIFIISDVTTFLVQASGGGLEAKDGSENLGRNILLFGIIAQYISYVIFYVFLVHSHIRFYKDEKFDEPDFPWRLFHVLHFSSVCIIIRSTYRTIEYAAGNDGYLATHEVFFYVLDFVPLFFATAIYTYWWPGRLIHNISARGYSVYMRPLDGVNA